MSARIPPPLASFLRWQESRGAQGRASPTPPHPVAGAPPESVRPEPVEGPPTTRTPPPRASFLRRQEPRGARRRAPPPQPPRRISDSLNRVRAIRESPVPPQRDPHPSITTSPRRPALPHHPSFLRRQEPRRTCTPQPQARSLPPKREGQDGGAPPPHPATPPPCARRHPDTASLPPLRCLRYRLPMEVAISHRNHNIAGPHPDGTASLIVGGMVRIEGQRGLGQNQGGGVAPLQQNSWSYS